MRRRVVAYGHYYKEFLATLTEKEIQKVKYVLSLLETDDRDEGQIVVLFNGFQKKTQKTPKSEIEKAFKLMEEYYEYKKQYDNRH